jgi:hypothetical protein
MDLLLGLKPALHLVLAECQELLIRFRRMIEKMIFPVLTFSRPNVIEFAKDEDRLTRCNRLGLKNGYYNNLKVIDSDGNCFSVSQANKVGTIGPLWGFNLFLEQQLRVRLEFKNSIERITLEDFKVKILNAFDKNKYYWESGGNIDDLKRIVRGSKSHGEIIQELGSFIEPQKK